MLKFWSYLFPRVRHIIFTSVVVFLGGYLIWQAIYSQRGILKYFQIKAELQAAYLKLQRIELEYANLEQKAKLLNPKELDRDLVDEMSRKSLGLAEPKEKIILNKER